MATRFPIQSRVLDHTVILTPNAYGDFWRCQVLGERLTFFGRTPIECAYKAFLHLGGGDV